MPDGIRVLPFPGKGCVMPGLGIALRALMVYVAVLIAGLGALYLTPDDAVPMIARGWWVQLLLAGVCVYYARRYFRWSAAGFGRLNWSGLVWMLPSYLVVAVLFAQLVGDGAFDGLAPEARHVLALIVLTTLLIGFSEEIMFRGILLRGALTRMGLMPAMLLSAVAFCLLHTVSGFNGQPLGDTLQQLAFTFLVGFFLAPMALVIGNLWPLILWHWLWDLVIFSSAYLNVFQPVALNGLLIQVVIGLWLWAKVLREDGTG